MPHILIVEDDQDIAELVARYLNKAGYTTEIVAAGRDALRTIATNAPDLLVLDLMLPQVDGLEICRAVRANTKTAAIPIIMLTARGEESDRIVGLEIGADDYLSKPFNPRELVARIRAVLRRTQLEARSPGDRSSERLTVDDVAVDVGRRLVRRGGAPVELTAVEFALLELLMRAAGSVVRREDLARGALGRTLLPFDRSIDVHVSHVRKKLGPRPDGGERITTLRAVGYLYTRESTASRG